MFQGFTPEAVEFLWGIKFNNNREWFLPRKEQFLALVDRPMRELGSELFDAIAAAYPKQSLKLHVCRIYREHGLERGREADMHEDQIGLGCEFMAILTGRALEALETDDEEALEAALCVERDFLKAHLLNWVPQFTADVTATALTDFYRGLAKVTDEFIRMDGEFLEDLNA